MINKNVSKVKREEIVLNKMAKININSNQVQVGTPDYIVDYSIQNDNSFGLNYNNSINSVTSNYVVSQFHTISDSERVALDNYKELKTKYSSDNIEVRNARLNWKIERAGYGTRDAVVAAAKYFSEEEKIPYLWGGKYYGNGIDGDWGQKRSVVPYYLNSKDQPSGSKPLEGLDCSGFVTWCIINGGYKSTDSNGNVVSYSESYESQLDGVKKYSISKETFNKKDSNGEYLIKAGDLLYRQNHIAIITNINRTYNTITIAEERGYALKDKNGNYIYDSESTGVNGEQSRVLKGTEITVMSIDEFIKYTKDKEHPEIEDHPAFTHILSMEDYYSNKDNVTKRK